MKNFKPENMKLLFFNDLPKFNNNPSNTKSEQNMILKLKKTILTLLSIFIISTGVQAQSDSASLFDVSLEDLMNIQVTSVSKKAEKLQNVPSSIYVITSRDIERSAATNLNELLKENVPGFWSATLGSNKYDSYLRNTFTGSVLVLIDGTPMQDLLQSTFAFSNFDIPLTEIDRIEVIRGSGGTVYGANSATGVISIYTKTATENKVRIGLKAGNPAYTNLSVSASQNVGNKFKFRTYIQHNYFGGFEQLKNFENDNPTVVNSLTGADTTIKNRFKNDRKTQNISFGINPEFTISEKIKLSANLHFNKTFADANVQNYPITKSTLVPDPVNGLVPFAIDDIYYRNDDRSRFVANIKADFKLSENNSLFARVSTNSENTFQNLGGGFESKNSIVDFELQDNITISFNTFSVGGNFRLLNYNLSNFYDNKNISFINPKNTENLKGLFIQDKISILNDKVNFYLGLKAENFSLINDNFYLSPLAKIVINPIEKLTIWGGYSKSYTTPGYDQTNIELRLFRINPVDLFTKQFYFVAYSQALQGGADPATADQMALNYISSQAGQDSINKYASYYPNEYSYAAINGTKTKPTQLENYEIGVRFQPIDKLYIESNYYYTKIKDGVFNSPQITEHLPSPTHPGEYINAYYYGNYIKGNNTGLETVLKAFPVKGLEIELSHTLFKYDIEFQENEEFDINILPAELKRLVKKDFPPVPKNIFRFKLTYELPGDWTINFSGLTTSAYYNRFGTVESSYEGDMQRFDPLYGGDKNRSHKQSYGYNDSRTILNFKLDKYLMNKKLDIYLWGNDFATKPFVESVNQLTTVYPQTTGRVLGIGINYQF